MARPARRFAYRLALALGEPHVDRLLEAMTARELRGWMAYYAEEPFGEERADVRAAMICQILAQAHFGRSGRSYKVEQFMPRFGRHRRRRAQSADEIRAILNAYTQAHNEAVKNGFRR